MNRKFTLLIALCFLLHYAYAQEVSYSLFLIGDTGEPSSAIFQRNIQRLKEAMDNAENNYSVMLLGDNVYYYGTPDSSVEGFEQEQQKLLDQLGYFKGNGDKLIIIPGNHDWDRMGKDGWGRILEQQKLANTFFDSTQVFFPESGCPGPVEHHLNDEILLVIFDSQWFLHPWKKPGVDEGCDVDNIDDFADLFEDIFRRNKHKKIVVASHHPFYTYGPHGKYYTFQQHLFPFTEMSPNLYIPLPVLGSIYPIFRSTIGSRQDIVHPLYKEMVRAIEGVMQKYPNTIHVAGHEHVLEYIKKDSLHFVVSGSGSKVSRVRDGKLSLFSKEDGGFARLDFLKDGTVKLKYIYGEQEDDTTFVLYNREYKAPKPIEDFQISQKTIVTHASDQYDRGAAWLVGENYRDIWKTDRTFEVFDIGKVKGGLKVIKKGGGQQTRSLRLEDGMGRQYSLRSVEKFAAKAVPEELRGTIAAQVVQDQISASHPYGAEVVPALANAAQVYHTNPTYYYIPDDPRLGPYRYDFANLVCLFEERPDDDMSFSGSFGNTKKVYSTPKTIEKLQEDNDNFVDQQWVVKSRLFDMFIGDWDRHDDQWRWASFKVGKGKMFRPIPRDRDQAFFVNQGLLMWGASRRWAMPKFQGFGHYIKHVHEFNFNARYFDRDFLNGPSLDVWLATADSLKERLNDQVIDSALSKWPSEIQGLCKDEISSKLKSQRNNLLKYAEAYYTALAQEVDIEGSNKDEYFRVERFLGDSTRITVYKKTKPKEVEKGDIKDKDIIYRRTFYSPETKEVRLYGLKGDDFFHIVGDGGRSLKVRIIGGGGDDMVVDTSRAHSIFKKTIVYDKKKGMDIKGKGNVRNKTSEADDVNEYDRKAFKYNVMKPQVGIKYNKDDGFMPGIGFQYVGHGFRKGPYKSKHQVYGGLSFRTLSFSTQYQGDFRSVFGKWNVYVDASLQNPNYSENFFGLGNESVYDKQAGRDAGYSNPRDYYRIRYDELSVATFLYRNSANDKFHFRIGVHGQWYSLEDEDLKKNDRYVEKFAINNDDPDFYERRMYYGLVSQVDYDGTDSKFIPLRGLKFNVDVRGYNPYNDAAKNTSSEFTQLSGNVSWYLTAKLPAQVTWASRVGGGVNFEDYEFFQAQKIGGTGEIRGLRKTRLYGDSKLYFNNELRLKLADIKTDILPFTLGIHGFYDIGRVWLEGENSDKWHYGTGGGVWLGLLSQWSITTELAKSEEDLLAYVRLGFMF